MKLYQSLVLSTLLYGAELWPLTVSSVKKVEAAHHKWQRSILGISWKDKVTNDEVRRRSALPKLENIIRARRLRWFGHVHRMNEERIPRQAYFWGIKGFRRRPGRPRQNWKDLVARDLKMMDITHEEAVVIAEDREEWSRRVAQCIFDAG